MKRFLSFFDGFVLRISDRILRSTEVPEWHASIFRILFGLFILLFETPDFEWLAEIPRSFFNPPYFSLARLFDGFPPLSVLVFLDVAAVISAVFLTLGVRARLAGFTFLLVNFIGTSFQFSLGKIDHHILYFATLFCFSFSNWGSENAMLPDRRWTFHAMAPAILAVTVAFGMFTAGFEKLFGWVDLNPATSGFLSWFYQSYFNGDTPTLLGSLVFLCPPIVLEAMDYTAVAFELSPFLWLLLGPVFWRCWLVAACVFHLFNAGVLNIAFTIHVMVYGTFFLYPLLREELFRKSRGLALFVKTSWCLAAVLGVIHIVQISLGQASNFLLIPAKSFEENFYTKVSIVIWLALIPFGLCNVFAVMKNSEKKDRL